jgi:hypothetical protein
MMKLLHGFPKVLHSKHGNMQTVFVVLILFLLLKVLRLSIYTILETKTSGVIIIITPIMSGESPLIYWSNF